MRGSWRVLPLLLLHSVAGAADTDVPAVPRPRVLHDQLRLDLYCREPQIATPVALDVDARGRVWVIESNTHFQQPHYDRHPTDRILILQGTREDGGVAQLTTFTDGLTHAMGLAWRGPGKLFLATRRDIMLLEDTDGNDRADKKTYLARLESNGKYPHTGLTGFAFDELGWVYFAMGENLAVPYRLVGADGKSLSGGPDGGSIFRMRADGSDLTRWAIGFWNTFHLAFDEFGRLFAVDNDPDSRPPCRLLHIVRGGDYGYRRWLGRRGLHPFTSWNGEIRGTLPMVAGTGEAPSGVVAYERNRSLNPAALEGSGLPDDLRGTLLVTSWGDHRIESYKLERRGASYHSVPRPIVVGDEMFRPVGMAVARDGSVYFSDWVDKEYNVHGKGRVWRLSRADPEKVRPDASATPSGNGPVGLPYDRLLSSGARWQRDTATRALVEKPAGGSIARRLLETSTSAQSRYHALVVLANRRELEGEPLDRALRDAAPEVRAAAIRLLRDTSPARSGAAVLLLLDDPDPAVRVEAMLALAGPFPTDMPLADPAPAAQLDRGQLEAAIEHLRGQLLQSDPFILGAALAAISNIVDTKALVKMATEAPPEHSAVYLLALRRKGNAAASAPLSKFLESPDPALRRAAMQWIGEEKLVHYAAEVDAALSHGPVTRALLDAYLATKSLLTNISPEVQDGMERDIFLSKIVMDREKSDDFRAIALRCMAPTHAILTGEVLEQLIRDPKSASSELKLEALRSLSESSIPGSLDLLKTMAADEQTPITLRREAIIGLARFLPGIEKDLRAAGQGDEGLQKEIERALRLHRARDDQGHAARPARSFAGLNITSLAGGRPAEGELLFNYPTGTKCSSCHRVRGRGGNAGPDLSTAGRMAPQKLLESILSPSKEIAPQFATWVVVTKAGVKTGIIAGEDADGTILLAQADGTSERIPPGDVISRETSAASFMPEDLVAALTVEELRDLLAYLTSLK